MSTPVPATDGRGKPPHGFRLGPWLVEPSLNRISSGSAELRIEGKAMDVLVVLASHPKALVTKEQLLESVWPNVVVVEGVIKRCVAQLRETLGDDAHEPRFIETIARKGYRLLATVEPLTAASPPTKPPTEPVIEPSVAQPRSVAVRAALVAAIAAAAVVLAVTWQFAQRGADAPGAVPGSTSIAVMPFEYFGDDSSKAWLASGLSEEIIHSLANVRELRVAARTSSFAFRAGTATVPEIARQLNVGAVLEGSVRMNGDDIRVTAQLIDAGTGLHVWSHVFDRDVEALFAVQDEIARNVAESLVGTDTGAGSAEYVSRMPPTQSFEAYALYLDALSLWRERSAEAHRRAADLLRAAIALDAGFARAHSLLGNVYYTMIFYAGLPYDEMLPLARHAAEEALRLDAGDSDALTLLGAVARSSFDWVSTADYLERRPGGGPQQFDGAAALRRAAVRARVSRGRRSTRSGPRCGSTRSRLRSARSTRSRPSLPAIKRSRSRGRPRRGRSAHRAPVSSSLGCMSSAAISNARSRHASSPP